MLPSLRDGPWLPWLALLLVALALLTAVALAHLPGSLGLHALAATAPVVSALLVLRVRHRASPPPSP